VHGEGSVTLQPASSLTGMQRRVDNLLGLPQLRCHLVRLALLVGYQGPLGLLETRLAHEQRASTPREILVSSCPLFPVPDLPAPSSRPRVARLPIVTPCLSCLSADAMPATRRARSYRLAPLADLPQESRSPRICETSGMPHTAPVGAEVILRLWQGPWARQRSRHCLSVAALVRARSRGR
jgi:hypothetical protein